MASSKLNLGYSTDYPSCSPLSNRTHYPALYVSKDSDDKDLQSLPSKGKAVVEYRVRSRTVSEDGDGKKRTSADIEIHTIEPITKKLAELSAKIDVELARGDRVVDLFKKAGASKSALADIETVAKRMPKGRRVRGRFTGNPLASNLADDAWLVKKQHGLAAKIDAHLHQFEDTRPRDPVGRFSGNESQGLDPMTMKQAYKKRRIPSLARIGGMMGRGLR